MFDAGCWRRRPASSIRHLTSASCPSFRVPTSSLCAAVADGRAAAPPSVAILEPVEESAHEGRRLVQESFEPRIVLRRRVVRGANLVDGVGDAAEAEAGLKRDERAGLLAAPGVVEPEA